MTIFHKGAQNNHLTAEGEERTSLMSLCEAESLSLQSDMVQMKPFTLLTETLMLAVLCWRASRLDYITQPYFHHFSSPRVIIPSLTLSYFFSECLWQCRYVLSPPPSPLLSLSLSKLQSTGEVGSIIDEALWGMTQAREII